MSERDIIMRTLSSAYPDGLFRRSGEARDTSRVPLADITTMLVDALARASEDGFRSGVEAADCAAQESVTITGLRARLRALAAPKPEAELKRKCPVCGKDQIGTRMVSTDPGTVVYWHADGSGDHCAPQPERPSLADDPAAVERVKEAAW